MFNPFIYGDYEHTYQSWVKTDLLEQKRWAVTLKPKTRLLLQPLLFPIIQSLQLFTDVVISDVRSVDDSQRFRSLNRMCETFAGWAETFDPCPVMFQIGFDADKSRIWGKMDNPAQELGTTLAEACTTDNLLGIIWVDFTLKDAMDKIPTGE